MKKNELSFKEKAKMAQEDCLCFCDEEISREAVFQVPIEVPEGFVVDSAEAVGTVTWNPDNLSCVSEPCLTWTGPAPEDISMNYAVRLQGTVTLLVSVSPVRNQYGQGNGAISVIHTEAIDQIVYYSAQSDDCPDFSHITIEDILVVPPFYGSPLTVTGTIIFAPKPQPRTYVFTANSNDRTVSVIDAALNAVVKTISFSDVPTGLGVTRDKAYTYVLHGNTNFVSVIDNETLTVTHTITLGGAPRKIQFESTGGSAYILASGSIYMINIASQSIINVIPVPGGEDFALDPNGQFAYTTNPVSWSIDKYDLNTGRLTDRMIDTFEYPSMIETPFAGDFAYVLNGELFPKSVTEINLSTFSGGSDFNRFFEILNAIVFSPDSTRAYFLEPYFDPFLTDNLTVVDTARQRMIANVSLPGAVDLTVTPDNDYIYAAQLYDNTVMVYRTSDYTAVTVIPVGAGPSAIAM
ncbi:hypothetical protein AXI59_11260 [Bacillus nakamurai]|uniref:YncE family protein n=1 Tax=Bacillus nakamurai TaxID=1793963 RepID=A0A150F505_9BACI|nr:YncE family protein [Bacillus nakamurai]KXZ17029.1 hypothetical protein AXI58_01130 [Bacillus nakamurai]KXZ22919.1 hypothetical protein AXI59_11260 [Bacillus nakamurai]MED1229028.1 YncE family protein [Bacillus nakamurai]